MNHIQHILKQQVEATKTPCVSYLHFNQNEILFEFAHGFADILHRKNIYEKANFHGFSVTKTFTAVAILQLIEEKKISLDESVKKYLPDLPYSHKISIRHLLTHTSGIPNPMPLSWIHTIEEHTSFNRDEFFKKIFSNHGKLKSQPGEKFRYTNLGYVILGEVIEKVSGLKYEAYITQNILERCGADPAELSFSFTDSTEHAKGCQKNLSVMNILLGLFLNKSKFMGKAEGNWKPFMPFYVNGTAYGGLFGTPKGFSKYIQALLRQQSPLLSPESRKLLFSENHLLNGKATGMCLSWFTGILNGQTYYSHAGGGGGYYCELRIYPQIDRGSVVFFNRSGMSDERFLDHVDVSILEPLTS